MPKHLLNFQLLTKTPLELLYWPIYSLNYTYLSNQHTSYSLLKTQTESNCQLPHHWQLPWFLSLFFQSPTTCKKGRHCSVHLFWFQWKFVIFPLFVGLFSLSLSLSLSCWDLVDFKLGGLILSSLLASCILGFHRRSCVHDMFANIALRNSVHYIAYHFDFTLFSQYFLWVWHGLIEWSGFSLFLYF